MLKEKQNKKYVKTVAVASGKGGVGKTNVTASLAIALKKMGKEVMIFDADLGLSNIDVLLHLAPKYNIQNILSGEMALKDVIVEGPHGIKILPASSGVQELTALDEFQRMSVVEAFDAYNGDLDILLVDTAAGISSNVAFFCVAAQEIIIIASPEPTALTDAYALIKVLSTQYQEKEFSVLVNSVKNPQEAMDVFKSLSLAAERFLNISLDYLGHIPFDESVRKSVRQQKAFVDSYPNSPASKQITEIALKIADPNDKVKGTLQFFIGSLVSVGEALK